MEIAFFSLYCCCWFVVVGLLLLLLLFYYPRRRHFQLCCLSTKNRILFSDPFFDFGSFIQLFFWWWMDVVWIWCDRQTTPWDFTVFCSFVFFFLLLTSYILLLASCLGCISYVWYVLVVIISMVVPAIPYHTPYCTVVTDWLTKLLNGNYPRHPITIQYS